MAKDHRNWWDVPAAVFLMAAIWFVGIRLNATGWIDHLEVVEFLAMSGCFLGLVIGRSRLNPALAKLIGMGYSIVILPWQLSLAAPLNEEYAERLTQVVGRLYTSILQFSNNQRLDDPIFFLACLSILYWSFSLISGYLLARYGRPWYPLAAAGAVLVMIEFYHAPGALGWESGAFAISLLLLAARLHYLKQRRRWDEKNLVIDSETGMGMGKSAFIVSLLVVIAAWNLPIFSPAIWKQVLTSSPDMLTPLSWQERLSKIVAAVNQSPYQDGDSFGAFMELGQAAASGSDILFTASVIESEAPGARYYWRAQNYDFYDSGSWVNSQDMTIDLAASEERFKNNEGSGRRQALIQFVISASKIRTLFTVGEPLSLSLPVKVTGEIESEEIVDVNAVMANEYLVRGDSYRQASLVAYPSREFLNETSTDYPAWVRARYLQLPAGLTQRTRDLAVEITSGMETPFEKAEAITAWLRREIEYESTIPDPPADREAMDWFLFDHKAGYCNFYATAEVILLRSLGIPARLAVGYAQGELDPETGRFVIRRKDSHAWPEVYFNGVGWVEFEPTASQPELLNRGVETFGEAPNQDSPGEDELERIRDREEGMMENSDPESQESEQPTLLLAAIWKNLPQIVLVLVGLVALVVIGNQIRLSWMRRKTTLPALVAAIFERLGLKVPKRLNFLVFYFDLSPVSRSFLLVSLYIRLMGGQKPSGATPAESVRLLNQLEPATSYYSQILLAEYEKETFSRQQVDLEVGMEAAGALRNQIFKSLWQRILNW